MNNTSPCIILVNPQMGENIGAAARAMLNFGLTDLRLVAPRDGWPNPKATNMAAGAFTHMPPPQIFDTLPEAIADLHYTYATTARPRDMVKPIFTGHSAAEDCANRAQDSHKTGFVFGPERTGLNNEDLSHCSAALTIPTNPESSSLNLGQCVLLVASEWHKANDATAKRTLKTGDSPLAEQAEIDTFLSRLEDELNNKRFFREATLKPTMLRNIRSIFTRAELTQQETRTLHGIISALLGHKVK